MQAWISGGGGGGGVVIYETTSPTKRSFFVPVLDNIHFLFFQRWLKIIDLTILHASNLETISVLGF